MQMHALDAYISVLKSMYTCVIMCPYVCVRMDGLFRDMLWLFKAPAGFAGSSFGAVESAVFRFGGGN